MSIPYHQATGNGYSHSAGGTSTMDHGVPSSGADVYQGQFPVVSYPYGPGFDLQPAPFSGDTARGMPATVDPRQIAMPSPVYEQQFYGFGGASTPPMHAPLQSQVAPGGLEPQGAAPAAVLAGSTRPVVHSVETPSANHGRDDSEEDEVAAELQSMVDKLSELQAKHPSRFARVWSNIKKVGLAVARFSGFYPKDPFSSLFTSMTFFKQKANDLSIEFIPREQPNRVQWRPTPWVIGIFQSSSAERPSSRISFGKS